MYRKFDVRTHKLGLTLAAGLCDRFYHLLCIYGDISVPDNLITTLKRKDIKKSVNVNKDTVCCNLDDQNICIFVSSHTVKTP